MVILTREKSMAMEKQLGKTKIGTRAIG